MGLMTNVVFDDDAATTGGTFSTDIKFDSITDKVLNPAAAGLTVPQEFTAGAAANQNLDKPTPRLYQTVPVVPEKGILGVASDIMLLPYDVVHAAGRGLAGAVLPAEAANNIDKSWLFRQRPAQGGLTRNVTDSIEGIPADVASLPQAFSGMFGQKLTGGSMAMDDTRGARQRFDDTWQDYDLSQVQPATLAEYNRQKTALEQQEAESAVHQGILKELHQENQQKMQRAIEQNQRGTDFNKTLRNTLPSIADSLIGVGLSVVASPTAGAAWMGAGAAATSYGDDMLNNVDVDAAEKNAAVKGLAEAGFEYLPLKYLNKVFTGASKFMPGMLKNIAAEVTTESPTTLVQDMSQRYFTGTTGEVQDGQPVKGSVGEYLSGAEKSSENGRPAILQNQIDTFKQTAMQSLIMFGTGAVGTKVRRQMGNETLGEAKNWTEQQFEEFGEFTGNLAASAVLRQQGRPVGKVAVPDWIAEQYPQQVNAIVGQFQEQYGFTPDLVTKSGVVQQLQKQAATGTGQTVAPGGEQGAGQSVAGAPAAAEGLAVPGSQAEYELQAAAEIAALQEQEQPVEDDIPDFSPTTAPQEQAAAVAPAVQPPAQPVGTLTKAAQTITELVTSRRAERTGLTMPAAQGINPVVPDYGSAVMPAAPTELDLAMQWGQQQLLDNSNTSLDKQNLKQMLNDANPQKLELVRYWRAFTGQRKQPAALAAAGGLTVTPPTVAQDSAPPTTPANIVAPAEVQQLPAPVAEATSPPAATGGVDQQAMITKVNAKITNLLNLVKQGRHTPQSAFDLLFAMPEYKQLSLQPVEVGNLKFGIDGNAEDLIFAAFEQAAQQKAVNKETVPVLSEENNQVLTDADLGTLEKGEVIVHSGHGTRYQFVGVDQDKSGNKGLVVKQIRQDGTVADSKSYLPLSAGLIKAKSDPVSKIPPTPATKPTDNGRRKGEVGMKLATDERVLTASGRLTSEFPKINLATKQTATNTLKRVDQWLMDNAIAEARSRGDKFNQRKFAANREKPSQADKDAAELYLFGEKQLQNQPASAMIVEGGTDNGKRNQMVAGSPEIQTGGGAETGRRDLQNAAIHARAVRGAVRETERQETPDPGQVELKGKQKELYAAIKSAEAKALQQLMEDVGQFPSAGFVTAWKQQGQRGETEHKVALSPDNVTVRKFGNAAVNHTWADYLDRLLLHNNIFGKTPYTFKGLSEIDGELHAVIDQPYITGDQIVKAPIEAIDKAMTGRGFNPFVRPQFAGKPTEVTGMARLWVHPESKVAVWDVRPANVLYDPTTQTPYFIDPMIEQLPVDFDLGSLTPLNIAEDGTVTGSRFQMIDGEVVPIDQIQSTPPTLSLNSKGNIDLKFSVRPDDATIERLTTAGFKFNQKQKVWYAGDSTAARKLAEELAGVPVPAVKSVKAGKPKIRNFLTEIKEAGGIKPQSLVNTLDKNEVNGGRWLRVKNKSGFGVDQMAIRMQTAGWTVPVDVDGNPDTNAFAQLLKDAVNGNPPVHGDNVDQAVTASEERLLEQIQQDDTIDIPELSDDELSEIAVAPVGDEALVDALSFFDQFMSEETDNAEVQSSAVDGDQAVAKGETETTVQNTGSTRGVEAPQGAEKSRTITPAELPSLDDFSALFDQMAGKDKPAEEPPVKPLSEVVSTSGEVQNKLFTTPQTFGKKPQTKGKAVDTGALLDGFTDESTVQPDMFNAPVRPSAEDSKAAIRAILAAKRGDDDGVVKENQSGYGVVDGADDETYLQLRPHILNLWQGAQNGDGLAEAVPRFITSLLKDFGADIKPYAETFYKEILNGDILEVTGGTQDVDNQHSSADLERNSQTGLAQPVGQGAVQPGGFGSTAGSGYQGIETTGKSGSKRPAGTAGISGRETAVAGAGRDSTVQGTVVGLDGSRPAGTELNQRSGDFVDAGLQVEPVATAAVDKVTERNDAAAVKREQQRLAQKVAVVPGDLENIRQSLPILLPGQDTDVQFAENRFAKPDGYGVLFTNGTGCGKTFSGLGIIKRFERQGKKNILIVVPKDEVIAAWLTASRLFGLDMTRLQNTTDADAGSGIVITTFANFGTNSALVSRSWDLVVADEAQYLNSNKSGGSTNAQTMLRAITLHPDGGWQRSQLLNAGLFAKYQAAHAKDSTVTKEQRETITKRWHEVDKQTRDAVAATKPEDRTRVLFLSATPFAYHKSIDYANGYLFDYNDGQPKDEYRGYNSGSNYDRFFMTHFGYRMRVGKLTEPPAEVNVGLMERMFNGWLKKNGVLSGRMLAVEQDYDRKFVLVDSAIGRKIDEGLEILRQDEYRPLQDSVWKAFDYLHRRFLLEAIKAKEVIPHIKEHIAMGRKVLVFHDYNQGGGINPFDVRHLVGNGEEVTINDRKTTLGAVASAFIKANPDLVELPFKQYGSALNTLQAAFPDALTVNGTNSKNVNLAAVEQFQTDNNDKNLIVVQADKGKEGISLHDTTGVHPRVMFNLGLPVKPTMSIQQEGRIYRTGQASNAMQRYMNTGTAWERYAFATTLARRASTAENLAMGEEARMLLDAFVQAYEDSDSYPAGHEGEGTGGKERDRAANSALTEWDRAVSYYFANQKKNSKTKAQEGVDYFATAEPLGFKMVEWADILPGESAGEPSAGHGAIARWFPELAKRRAIEPSLQLASRLALNFDGDIVQGSFEDHNTINKYDAIVMNPPFGTAGKTAMEHVAKAAQHLKDNGRIVALIPSGPAMDKRFDKWLYDEKVEKVEPLYTDAKLGAIYRGDTLTFNGFGKNFDMVVQHVDDTGAARYARPRGADMSQAVNLIAAEKLESTGPREKRTPNPMQLTAEILLPSVAFERAGTSVNTRIVILDKGGDQSFTRRDYSRADNINDFFERIKDSNIPGRQHASQPNNDTTPVTIDQVQPDGTVAVDLQSDDFTLTNFPHTQSGATMYAATLKDRDAAKYARALSLVKKHGGYYSKYSKAPAVAGFLFKDEASRGQFLQAMDGEATHVSESTVEYRAGTTETEIRMAQELVRAVQIPGSKASTDRTGDVHRRLERTGRNVSQELPGVIASSIAPTLAKTGVYDFVGKTITSPDDLAAIAQVYRNPQFETLRYFFTKDGKVVGQLGVSSRLPGVSAVFPQQSGDLTSSKWLQHQVQAFDADGYWLLHNHPSGNVQSSDEDMQITRKLATAVPGFKGHVIINHNKYGLISRNNVLDGKDAVIERKFNDGPDPIRIPGKPNPMLGRELIYQRDLVRLGKELQIADGQLLLVVQGARDQGIVGLAELSLSTPPVKIAAYLRRLARRVGGQQIFAVVPDNINTFLNEAQKRELGQMAEQAIREGFLMDALIQDQTISLNVPRGQRRNVFFGKKPVGYVVKQSAWTDANDADVTITTEFSLRKDSYEFSGVLRADDIRKALPWAEVVQSVDEIPEKVKSDAAKKGAKLKNIEAFVHNGKVWLVADNLNDISRAKVLAHGHELAHLGQDEKLVDLAEEWFKSTEGDDAPFKQEAHRILQEEVVILGLDLNKPEDYRTAVREATARMAEDMAAKGMKPGLIQKIVNHLRELLRKLGRPLRVTDQELAGAVAEMLRLGEKRISGSLSQSTFNKLPTATVRAEAWKSAPFSDVTRATAASFTAMRDALLKANGYSVETHVEADYDHQSRVVVTSVVGKNGRDLMVISRTIKEKEIKLDKVEKLVDGNERSGALRDIYAAESAAAEKFAVSAYGYFVNDITARLFEEYYNGTLLEYDDPESTLRVADLSGYKKQNPISDGYIAAAFYPADSEVQFNGKDRIPYYDGKKKYQRANAGNKETSGKGVSVQAPDNRPGNGAIPQGERNSGVAGRRSGLTEEQLTLFSLRSDIQNAVKSIPWEEVIPTTKENWKRFFNPLDWSRSRGVIQDLTPEVMQAAIGDFFATPVAQAERDPAKGPFVAEGADRETDRMQIILDMYDFKPGQKDTRSPKEKIVDAFTKLHSGPINTEWEKLNQRLFALKDLQRKAFDLIFVEGDAMGSEYASLAVARLNPRLAKAPGMNAEVFELYKDIRHHMDVTVAEARVKHMMELLKLVPDLTDKQRERHIAEYRNQLRKVRGWMTRDHGKGRFQATVYHVFTAAEMAEDWKAKELFDKDGEPSGMQYVLPYYPGNKVMEIIENRVKEGWQEAKAKVVTTDKGLVVITLTGAAESAMEDLGSVIDEQMKDASIKVMTYMHRFETKLGAKAHRNLVAKDLKKAMPRTYIDGHRYEVAPVIVADDLSEELFQAVKGDIALEQILKKSLDNALKRGEIDKEKHTTLHNELVQDVAEVLLSRAAGRYQIRRAPYLIEGYATEGVMSLYQDYITGVAGMLSKAKYAMKQYKHLEEAKAEVKPWATAYVFDTLRNMGLADRIGGDVRALASLWLMGFKLSSAMINATQPYTLGLAELKRRMPEQSAIKLISQAQGNILTGKGLQQDEKAIFETAVYKHQEMINAVSEVSGHNEGSYTKAGKLLHGLAGKSLALFQQVEILNRKTMILAAYRAYRAEGTPPGIIDEAALKMAMEVNSAVNFEMGRHNLPGFARKSAVGRTLFSLQPYAWNSLNLIFNRLTSGEKRDQIALLRYAGMMFLLGGAMALPGGDELDKLYRKLRGRSLKVDLQEWSGRHAAEYGTIGEMANGFAWYGMPSLAGINASNAMRLQMPIVSQLLADNSALEAVTGVPGALVNKVGTTAMYLERGAPLRALEAGSPEFVAGPLRATRMYWEGATTSHGKRIFDEEGQPLRYSAGDAMKRGLGFQPLKQSQRSALTEQMRYLERYWSNERRDLMDAIRFAVDDKARDEAITKVQEYNSRLLESQILGPVMPINGDAIRRGLTYKPDKKDMAWKQQHSN